MPEGVGYRNVGLKREYAVASHATPYQKTLPIGLGTTKADGMGKTRRIGMKKEVKTELT